MTAQSALLELVGGVTLLLWATRLIRTGVERAFGEKLKVVVSQASGNRFRAAATGLLVAGALQSASATTLLATSFAERGLLQVSMALAVVLGADLGSTLVVKFLSYDVRSLVSPLLALGYGLFTWGVSGRWRNLGRAIIGLALVLLALGMIMHATQPLRGDSLLPLLLQRLEEQWLLAVLVAAAVTLGVQSSVAIVLLFMSLAASGSIAPSLGLALVLGANVGSACIPVLNGWSGGHVTRRIVTGNLLFRTLVVIALLPFVPIISDKLSPYAAGAAFVSDVHLLFNALVVSIWLPFCRPVARELKRMMPTPVQKEHTRRFSNLVEDPLATPAVVLAGATRETLNVADKVESMLRETILTFEPDNVDRIERLRKLDDEVDSAQEAIKQNLAGLTRAPLSETDMRKAFDLIIFVTNLEHVGDIIDKNLLELARKKSRLNASFSAEGWQELRAMHERAVEHARLAITVFVTGDVQMARQLVEAKDQTRGLVQSAADNHLLRLRAGHASTVETSSLHLDILRDLKRIIAYLTNVAYPILEASGQLRQTRLN